MVARCAAMGVDAHQAQANTFYMLMTIYMKH